MIQNTFERFQDEQAHRLWCGEFWGHDVSIAQPDKRKRFLLWIDAKYQGSFGEYSLAHRATIKFAKPLKDQGCKERRQRKRFSAPIKDSLLSYSPNHYASTGQKPSGFSFDWKDGEKEKFFINGGRLKDSPLNRVEDLTGPPNRCPDPGS